MLAGEPFTVGALRVMPVLLPHDAVETVGYVVGPTAARASASSPTAATTRPKWPQAYAGCDVLVLECNHDVTMLRYGPYPPSLKRRVGGRLGHLSNDQSASLLKMMLQAGPPPKLVIAAHLSLANNRAQLAKSALDRVLGRGGRVIVATSTRGTPIFIDREWPRAK